MQTKFKRHAKVRLLVDANSEYVEYTELHVQEKPQIKKGMTGKINILLPNGQYHVAIIDEKTGEIIAYVPFDEECLEAVED